LKQPAEISRKPPPKPAVKKVGPVFDKTRQPALAQTQVELDGKTAEAIIHFPQHNKVCVAGAEPVGPVVLVGQRRLKKPARLPGTANLDLLQYPVQRQELIGLAAGNDRGDDELEGNGCGRERASTS
jgi:hypothetical protein